MRQTGFSLVELSIVLLIVALLLGGLLPTVSSQIEQQQMNETRKQMSEIMDALTGFAVINGRLPCPADGTAASGIEATTGSGTGLTCNLTDGVLPWASLGVSETDAWGRRFTYRVSHGGSSNFADGAYGTDPMACGVTVGVSFQICSIATLEVLNTSPGGSIVADKLPAVVVSHGPNGLGAYPAGGGAQIGTAIGEEAENTDGDNTFVSHGQVQNGYDDIVVWLSPNTLINRMVAAGRLP